MRIAMLPLVLARVHGVSERRMGSSPSAKAHASIRLRKQLRNHPYLSDVVAALWLLT